MADDANGTGETEPVNIHSQALDELLGRAATWIQSAKTLRSNIRSFAQAQKDCAVRLKKTAAGPDQRLEFAVSERQKGENGVEQQDSLRVCGTDCFNTLPTEMAAYHEEMANQLFVLDNKQGRDLEKLANKHKAAVESAVCGLWESLTKKRENLQKKIQAARSVTKEDEWLLTVQETSARLEEREASSLFCKQAQTIWNDVEEMEHEILEKFREVMSMYIATQSASVSKLDLGLENHSRNLKVIDSKSDFDAFKTQPRVAPSVNNSLDPDWRSWNTKSTAEALQAETNAGSGINLNIDARNVVCSGYLLRQGTVLGFNWHRHYFVLTTQGYLHYFPSEKETAPQASYLLSNFKVQLEEDSGALTIILHPKASSWFSSGSPTKISVKADKSSETSLAEWSVALRGLSLAPPMEASPSK
mmetsp:Transcript_14367/g.22288  ORF Transcript_14367/g.22288 Transcript_14367/m.22288 type:complete len:417 (-) Transcript_14367:113-1363(-)